MGCPFRLRRSRRKAIEYPDIVNVLPLICAQWRSFSRPLYLASSQEFGIIPVRNSLQGTPVNSDKSRFRIRYSTVTLLAVMAIACFSLSRFYPRVYSSVTVDFGNQSTMVNQSSNVVPIIALAPKLLAVYADHCSVEDVANGDAINWLQNSLSVTRIDDHTVRFSLVGYAKDRERLPVLADAIVEQFLAFEAQSRGESATETLRLMETARGEVSEKQQQAKTDPEKERYSALLSEIDKNIAQIKFTVATSPEVKEPKVVKRHTGWRID